MQRLAPCRACRRHVRVADPTCPFCGDHDAARVRASVRQVPRFASRSVLLGVAVATGACNLPLQDAATADGGAADGGADEEVDEDRGAVVAHYGAPACDVLPGPVDERHAVVGLGVAATALLFRRRRRS